MSRRLLGICIWMGFVSLLRAQTDFTHMDLEVWPDTLNSAIHGKVKLRFQAGEGTDSIGVNGIEMSYDAVTLNGTSIPYSSNDKALWFAGTEVRPGENQLEIEYNCQPRKGIFFIGWDDASGVSPRQVWTQGQGIDHRHWIPHKDDQTDKLTLDIRIHFSADYQAIANGELVSRTQEEGGTSLWHYHLGKPMSSYLIAIAIGKYDSVQTRGKNGVPLTQYYYPEREKDYSWYYAHNEDIFNFMNEAVGMEFPWPNYKQVPVKDFHHGAMENTTATIFGDFFLVDEVAFNDRNYTYVNAHELAHQWFGNLVTATGSDHHWLHEGFATYYQWLSERNLYGEDHFDWLRWEEAQLVFEASRSDSVPLGNGKAGSYRFYQKGAWVLQMLKDRLGEEDYKKVIQHYLQKNAFGVVNTDSLNSSIRQVTSKDFSGFFNDWVFTAGEPVVKFRSTVKNGIVELEYIPVYMPFESIPLRVKVKHEEGATFSSFVLGSEAKTFKLNPAGNKISYWVINPDMEQLMSIHEEKPYPFWISQYEESESVIDRYLAVKGLKASSEKGTGDYLLSILENTDEHYAVRAEALKQMKSLSNEKKFNGYIAYALRDEDVQLQKEAILLVKDPDKKLLKNVSELRKGRSYILRNRALELGIDVSDPEANRWLYDDIYTSEPGIPGRKVEISALFYRAMLFNDKEALQTLKLRTSQAYDFITRMNAIEAMSVIGYLDEEVCGYYFNALFAYNWQLRRKASELLKSYYAHNKSKKVILQYIENHKNDFSDFQKRVVSATFELNTD